ncbi:MAG TPA: gluconokinase [Burkholderiales bacterium]|nr:gluconokinase [Burkholderiales bacterium]
MIVVVMGVSGAGKSTIGEMLAARLNCRFLDADQFHPAANVEKMAAGTPLTDADRWPWLQNLNAKLRQEEKAVLACSALKESYRQALSAGLSNCRFVHLRGDIDLIRARLGHRQHRYMPASLLESQFAALEPPRDAIDVDIGQPPERCVEDILAALG